MLLSADRETDVVAILREAGLKLTPQRLAVVQELIGDDTHPTVQTLMERLRPRFPTLSVATVYNTVAALTDLGCCRQLSMGGATRIDPNTLPHDHAVCERCGAIRDVDASHELPLAGPQVAGCEVQRVERIYRGICEQCSGAAATGA